MRFIGSTSPNYINLLSRISSPHYQLHQQLDALVRQANGFSPDDDRLAKLLDLTWSWSRKRKMVGRSSGR